MVRDSISNTSGFCIFCRCSGSLFLSCQLAFLISPIRFVAAGVVLVWGFVWGGRPLGAMSVHPCFVRKIKSFEKSSTRRSTNTYVMFANAHKCVLTIGLSWKIFNLGGTLAERRTWAPKDRACTYTGSDCRWISTRSSLKPVHGSGCSMFPESQ